jgi:peptide methionine sulfoxide reductase MsrB
MNYNHITYGQQKVISPKKTEATATGIDGDFITRISICRHCDTPFYCSGYTSNAGYGLPSFRGRFRMVMRHLSDSGRIRTHVKRVLSCGREGYS